MDHLEHYVSIMDIGKAVIIVDDMAPLESIKAQLRAADYPCDDRYIVCKETVFNSLISKLPIFDTVDTMFVAHTCNLLNLQKHLKLQNRVENMICIPTPM